MNNPANPKAEVRFSEQSWEEMMVGFPDLAISDLTMDSRKFMTPPRPGKWE